MGPANSTASSLNTKINYYFVRKNWIYQRIIFSVKEETDKSHEFECGGKFCLISTI